MPGHIRTFATKPVRHRTVGRASLECTFFSQLAVMYQSFFLQRYAAVIRSIIIFPIYVNIIKFILDNPWGLPFDFFKAVH